MNWKQLTNERQLEEINRISEDRPVLIFKHSTSCGISLMMLEQFEQSWSNSMVEPYFLDLLAYRALSNKVAEDYNIIHQSPQVILIRNGSAIYQMSHTGINAHEIDSIAKELEKV